MAAKTEPLHFFLGANTPQGFVSRFDQLGNADKGWRCYVIKGGPGSGKSTLMKKVAAAAAQTEPEMELIHCSSDRNSLDGVILPGRKISIADGTPPHTIEPKFPGAYEVTVPLFGCWDDDKLWLNREEIIKTSRKISGVHEYCVRFLTAAGSLLGDSYRMALEVTDKAKIGRYATAFVQRELGRPKVYAPQDQARFLSAITDGGPTLFEETAQRLAKRIIFVEDEWGAASRLLLTAVRSHALKAGFRVVSCYCPLAPFDKLDHLFIPEAGVGLMTVNKFHPVTIAPTRTIHARRFCDIESLKLRKKRISFNTRAAGQMLDQAARLMGEAKLLHDGLEEYYKQATDYAKVDELTDRFVKKIVEGERDA